MQDVPPHSLSDYREAINSLNESTNTIEIQVRATTEILSTIFRRRSKIRNVADSPSDLTRQQISTLVENLKREIHDENKISSEKLRKQLSSSLITISDTLRRDDHIFGQLESQITLNDSDHNLDDERNEALLDTLRYTLSEVIKTRLNRIYLETLGIKPSNRLTNGHQDTDASYNTTRESTRQTDDIKADLRSLHAEIDDVAQMRVNHEHGDKLSITMKRLEDSQQHLATLRTTQMLNKLKSMTDQLEQIVAHCEALQSQRIAQQRLEAQYAKMTGAHQPRHHAPTMPTKVGIGMDEGPAIAALRQYLNLDQTGSVSIQRERQAKEALEEYTAYIQTSLELRNQQAGFLEGIRGGEAESSMPDGTAHESKLTELDAHIARLREQMEKLSG